MQIDRLFQIVYILLNREKVTAKELSETFSVSTRTIYRDVETLSLAGIPIYTNKGKGGGISLLDNFKINKSVLSNEEQNNILVGLEVLKATEYEDVNGAILKLKNLFNKNNDNWIEVDFSNWGSSKEDKVKFEALKYSLVSCKTIKFDYYNSSGDKTSRDVNPIKLVFKHKSWYLKGFCLLKSSYRTFKVHRMKKVIVTENTFDREGYNLKEEKSSYEESRSLINLKAVLLPKVKYRIYDELDEKCITKNSDGSYTIDIIMPENEWLYNYIISFGENIKVIKPTYINDIIKNKLEKILKSYK